MSVHAPLMTRTGVSYNLGILVSKDNPGSYVQVDGSSKMSSVPFG